MIENVRILSADGTAESSQRVTKSFVMVRGVKYPLYFERKGWRAKKVSRRFEELNVDLCTGIGSLVHAKAFAKEKIESGIAQTKQRRKGGGSLRKLCDAYETKKVPRQCRDYVASNNVKVLQRIVNAVHKKTLDAANGAHVSSELWSEYARIEQGGELQYAIPIKRNAGINADIRAAMAIFSKPLIPHYEKLGFRMNWTDIRTFMWLKTIKDPKGAEPAGLTDAIRGLRGIQPHTITIKGTADEEDQTIRVVPEMWRPIGLVRFAGLRPKEVRYARRSWLWRDSEGRTLVKIKHRPDEGFLAKEDEEGDAVIMDRQLADDLWALQGAELLAPHPEGRSRVAWLQRDLCDWVRQFIPDGHLALHRLRGFNGDQIKRDTADELRIQDASDRVAQKQLRHASVSTTRKHYLSDTKAPLPTLSPIA